MKKARTAEPTSGAELPVIEWLGMHKTPKGHVVLACKTQGRNVIEEEALTDGPVSRMEAENVFRVAAYRRFLLPREAA